MADPRGPLYLARATYRQRRLIDALRLLPIFMLSLWLLPLLWHDEAGAKSFLHIFVVWALGIVSAALLSSQISRSRARQKDSADESGGPGAC